jgi:predicted phosphodiesterase
MKYAIIADIHGNLEALQAVLGDIKYHQIPQIACLGDIVGYYANPRECLELVRALNGPCVKGNHDEYCASELPPAGVNPRAWRVIQWTRNQLTVDDRQWLGNLPYVLSVANFTIGHATLNEPQRWGYVFDKLAAAASFPHQQTPVCFFGHTHVPFAFVRDTVVRGGTYSKFKIDLDKKYFINPGSVGQPRDNDPRAAYGIYDLAAGTMELRRLDYDIDKTQQKARDAGL